MKKPTRALSKSKLLAYRQCHRRLWLEVHKPELKEDSPGTEATFANGRTVGDLARRLYDPAGKGTVIDLQLDGLDLAMRQSRELLESSRPIFEAGFSTDSARAFADVMLPVRRAGRKSWRMVEVKSATKVKDYYRDDAAIQAHIAREAGIDLDSVAIAHIDNKWVYPGDDAYEGILKEVDVTEEAQGRKKEVQSWIEEAQGIVRKRSEPEIHTGNHCSDPYECSFRGHCEKSEPKAKYPVEWLPRIQAKALKEFIEDRGVIDMRKVPDELLNERQRLVKKHTLANETFFDAAGALSDLSSHRLPLYFLDFETINFVVPIWKGTRPYQQVPFQFSLHVLSPPGTLTEKCFLDLSGSDPSRAFAEALVAACGRRGPVFVYSATFEKARIAELAHRFPVLRKDLSAIADRIVDLLKVARERFYHPSQEGKWGLKRVLPAVAPELHYDSLDGVQDGGMAMEAYKEAISSGVDVSRKAEIRKQLLDYCKRDTFGLVKIWQFFADRTDLKL